MDLIKLIIPIINIGKINITSWLFCCSSMVLSFEYVWTQISREGLLYLHSFFACALAFNCLALALDLWRGPLASTRFVESNKNNTNIFISCILYIVD